MSRILLVEDDPDQRAIRKLLLEHAGHQVAAAEDGSAARMHFAALKPRLVLLDLHLRGTDEGLLLIREFRAANPQIRIVVMSGWTTDLQGRDEAAMVDAVVEKPAQTARVLNIISQLVA